MSSIFFNGPAGNIEGKYYKSKIKDAPVALLLHSHPLHGGSMNDKVVHEMYKTFAANDFTVLKINFRGVGKSDGSFDNGVGEFIDAATALDWLEIVNPASKQFWIGGFSFGAWIAMKVTMRRPDIDNFVIAAPPVNRYDFSFLVPCPTNGIVIHGSQDSIVLEDKVIEFISKVSRYKGCKKIDYKSVQHADHFFRGKLSELGVAADQYIKHIKKEQKRVAVDDKVFIF
jgi:alpha/beta superfamily hydrolase